MSSLSDYFDALERLKNNKPIRVPRGTKITNDAVSLEAGRNKGSIKKGRETFKDLITAINEAAREKPSTQKTLDRYKNQVKEYRERYEQAIGREVMLVKKVYALEAELAKLRPKNTVPITSR